jgi:hypothetical protein
VTIESNLVLFNHCNAISLFKLAIYTFSRKYLSPTTAIDGLKDQVICQQAKFYHQYCPNIKMDGNNDGSLSERQWCN